MIAGRLPLLAAMLVACPAAAQYPMLPSMGGSHVQTVQYRQDQVIPLEVAVGYVLTVELASDDPIQNIVLGDASGWLATMPKSADRIFVQAASAGSDTNMTVFTANRRYMFDLKATADASANTAYVLRFRYTTSGVQAFTPPQPVGRYKLRGAKELRPSAISDDGIHTAIIWPPEASLPAVFALDDRGGQTIVNGFMRDGVFVVDAIKRRLMFRIDDRTAYADRVVPAPAKPR